jgi:molecular chaperone HtpG
MNRDVPTSKGTLEINPGHPLIATMRELLRRDEKHPKLEEYADLLFDQALLTAGLPVDDLLQFTRRVSNLMTTEAQGLAGQGPAQPAPAAG